ncbi:MAG: metal-sulfur cluster assembly factor [Burkholderiaceae bacterium]|nr:metal-sulfur cluster assembly factor [Burkholderiaceae bacterium]
MNQTRIEGSDPGTAELALDALRAVIDPEMGMDVVDLGMIYAVEANEGRVRVEMTMTSAACPMADSIVRDARAVLERSLPEPAEIEVELVWDPPWTPAMMSDEARSFFGWEG